MGDGGGQVVLTRDQHDPTGPLVRRRITRTYQRTAYALQILTVRDENGVEQTLKVTEEHPFYRESDGWTPARKLDAGDIVLGADGPLTVVSNEAEQHPGGVTVYNLEVEQAHTYFVLAEHANDAAAVWVHNTCEKALGLRRYIRDIEAETGVRIGKEQRRLLANAVRGGSFKRLSPADYARHTDEFNATSVIEAWENNTGSSWPRHHTPVFSNDGTKVLRDIGDPYEVHHIIEQVRGGPHEWWNAQPARFPDQHQGGIHRAGGILRTLFS